MKFKVILPVIFLPLFFVAGDKLSKKETISEVAAINKILGSVKKKHNIKVPAKLDDALLARRLYLKAAGRIPTHEELTSYLANPSKDKKNQLINKIVALEKKNFNQTGGFGLNDIVNFFGNNNKLYPSVFRNSFKERLLNG